jgi:hypothetical protein
MVTLVDCHTAGQIDCAARDLANCGTPVSSAAVRYAVTIWRTLEGSTAPHVMPVTQSEIAALIAADQEEAHQNACEAFHAIEALQRTGTWIQLPLSARRQLSAAHATLGALADALAGE